MTKLVYKKTLVSAVVALFIGSISFSSALENGLGRTPPMGWNTWNRYYCDINQTIIYTNTDSLIRLGLADIGYKYVNVDDCWLTKERDSRGHVIVDPHTFPDGMKAIGDYIHS